MPVPLVSERSGCSPTPLQDFFGSPVVQTSGFQPADPRMPGQLWVISEGFAVGSCKTCKTIKLLAVGSELLDGAYTWTVVFKRPANRKKLEHLHITCLRVQGESRRASHFAWLNQQPKCSLDSKWILMEIPVTAQVALSPAQ